MLKVHMSLVSRNAGNEKNRHLGVCKFIFFFYQLNLLNKVYTSGTTLTAGVGLVKQGAGFVIYLFIYFFARLPCMETLRLLFIQKKNINLSK